MRSNEVADSSEYVIIFVDIRLVHENDCVIFVCNNIISHQILIVSGGDKKCTVRSQIRKMAVYSVLIIFYGIILQYPRPEDVYMY